MLFTHAALFALLTSPAYTTGPVNGGPIGPDPCGMEAADTSATLGPDTDSIERMSGLPAYSGKSGCKRFVADFHVLSTADPASNIGTLIYHVTGDIEALPNQAASCGAVELVVSTFEKAVGARLFEKRTSAKYKGTWIPGGYDEELAITFPARCGLVKVSGKDAPSDTPNPAGTEIWRVAVSGTVHGKPMPVKASIWFEQVPR